MGGKAKDPNKAAMKAQKAQMKRLDAIDMPELEEYILQNPDLVGLLDAEQLDESKLGEIALDPTLRDNQMKALESLSQRSEEGLTASDKYEMEKLLGDVDAQRMSAQEGIEAQMARRGMDSSGAAERAKRENVQSAANSARDKAMQMAAMGQQNKMAALAQLGQQSGQMNQQDFARKAQVASAKDAISRANAMNRQNVSSQNLAARQAIENQRAGTANQQAQVANQLKQQGFTNQIAKATGQGNVANSMSNIAGNAQQKPSGLQSALGGASTGAGIGASIGGPVGAGYGAAIGAGAGALSSMFEDGGIVNDKMLSESLPVQYQNTPMDAEFKEKEIKQHEAFKKKYMKRIQDEVMGNSPKPKTPEKPKANNGLLVQRTPEEQAVLDATGARRRERMEENPSVTNSFDAADRGEELQSPGGLNADGELSKDNLSDKKGMSGKDISAGLGALNKMLNPKQEKKAPLNLGAFKMDQPKNVMAPVQPMNYANPFAAEDGGAFYSDGSGDIVDSGMESYAGDRVDARLNDKEIVVNVPQQQRLMDLIRGEISVDELGTDDIVEGVPRDFRDDMHEELDEEVESSDKLEGIQELLKMLEK